MRKKNSNLSKTAISFWIFICSIMYTYFGYPLLITLLAHLKPKPNKYPETTPTVTLLIAAYNEAEIIEEKIKNSLEIDYPRNCIQILIVADGSNDETPDLVKKHSQDGVELLFESERRGKMAAINRAVPHARGEIIIFSDANNLYQSQTIKALVAPFSDPQIGAVSGAKMITKGNSKVGQSEGLYWKYEAFIKKQESRLNSCTTVAGEVWAIRKEAYLSPPDKIINDDFYMAMLILKQGYRLVYAPDAASVEQASVSAQGEITRRKRIIAGRYQAIFNAFDFLPFKRPLLIWQIVSHKFMRPLVPFFMIGSFLSNIVLVARPKKRDGKVSLWALTRPFNILALALQFIFYGLAWIGNTQEKKESKGKLRKLLYLPTFLFNSNLAAFQGFIEYIKGEQSHIWERVSRQ